MCIPCTSTVYGCWSSAKILKPACRVVVMTPCSEMSIVCFHVEPLSSKPMQLSDTAHETHWRHRFLSHNLNTNKAFVSSDKHTTVFWWFDCFKCTTQLRWEDAAVRRTRINLIGLGLFVLQECRIAPNTCEGKSGRARLRQRLHIEREKAEPRLFIQSSVSEELQLCWVCVSHQVATS